MARYPFPTPIIPGGGNTRFIPSAVARAAEEGVSIRWFRKEYDKRIKVIRPWVAANMRGANEVWIVVVALGGIAYAKAFWDPTGVTLAAIKSAASLKFKAADVAAHRRRRMTVLRVTPYYPSNLLNVVINGRQYRGNE